MMAKTSLGALVGKIPDSTPPGQRTDESLPEPSVRPTSLPRSPAGTPGDPLYLQLARKDTRIREEQLAALTAHARRLSRAKRGGERITENTLIRVAIDLLLERIDRAAGVDEDEIRESLR